MAAYLTQAKKDYYMEDFNENVLTCENDSFALDAGTKAHLTLINENHNLQTLYSQKKSRDDYSYIKFAFRQEVENVLFREVIANLTRAYSSRLDNCQTSCYYTFIEPHKNANLRGIIDGRCHMACELDDDYFMINHIAIHMHSRCETDHKSFWEQLAAELSEVGK